MVRQQYCPPLDTVYLWALATLETYLSSGYTFAMSRKAFLSMSDSALTFLSISLICSGENGWWPRTHTVGDSQRIKSPSIRVEAREGGLIKLTRIIMLCGESVYHARLASL